MSLQKITYFLKKTVGYAAIFLQIIQTNGLRASYIPDVLDPEVKLYQKESVGIISSKSLSSQGGHNFFSELNIYEGGMVFETPEVETSLFNEVGGHLPSKLSGTIESHDVKSLIFTNPKGIELENPDFKGSESLSLIGGKSFHTPEGMMMSVTGPLSLHRAVFKGDEDVKNLSLVGATIDVTQSILDPLSSLRISSGRQIWVYDTGHGEPLKEEGDPASGSTGGIYGSPLTILRSHEIFIENFDPHSPIFLEGLLCSTGGNITIRAIGDIILGKVSAASNLTIETLGRVILQDFGSVEGNLNIKAGIIDILKEFTVQGDVRLRASKILTLEGDLTSQKRMSLLSQGEICLKGNIRAEDAFVIGAKGHIIQQGRLFSGGILRMKGLTLTKKGDIEAKEFLKIHTVENLENINSTIVSQGPIKLLSQKGIIHNSGIIFSQENLEFEASKIQNNGVISTRGILKTQGSLENNSDGKLRARSFKGDLSVLGCNQGEIEFLDDLILEGDNLMLGGHIKTHGYLFSKGAQVENVGHLIALKGGWFEGQKFVNKGSIKIQGEETFLKIEDFENLGTFESEFGTRGSVGKFINRGNFRNRRDFILRATEFMNHQNASIYTCGLHQVDALRYTDNGTLYVPNLGILRADIMTLKPKFQLFGKEVLFRSTKEFSVQGGSHFLAQKYLQFSSQHDMKHEGEITISQTNHFPYLDYFEPGDILSPTVSEFLKELSEIGGGRWKEFQKKIERSSLRAELVFNVLGDLRREGEDNLGDQGGSIKYFVGKTLKSTKSRSRVSSREGSDIILKAMMAILDESLLTAPVGRVQISGQKSVALVNTTSVSPYTQMIGDEIKSHRTTMMGSLSAQGTDIHLQGNEMKHASVKAKKALETVSNVAHGRVQLEASSAQMVRDKIEGSTHVKVQNHLHISDLKATGRADIKAESANIEGSNFEAFSAVEVQINLDVSKSTFEGVNLKAESMKLSGDQFKGTAKVHASKKLDAETSTFEKDSDIYGKEALLKEITFGAAQHRVTGDHITATDTVVRKHGDLLVEGEKILLRNVKGGGSVHEKAQKEARFEGEGEVESLSVSASHVVMDASVSASQAINVDGDHVENHRSLRGETVEIKADRYDDTSASKVSGGKVKMKVPSFKGTTEAREVEYYLNHMGLLAVLEQTKAQKTEVHLEEEVSIVQDLILNTSLHLWAKSLENKSKITANGNFIVDVQKSILNSGVIDGKEHLGFKAGESFVNQGQICAQDDLFIKAQSILNERRLKEGRPDGTTGIMTGKKVQMEATERDIDNHGGLIAAREYFSAFAKGSILQRPVEYQEQMTHDRVTRYGGAHMISGGKFDMEAEDKIVNDSSTFASEGDMTAKAKNGLEARTRFSVYVADRKKEDKTFLGIKHGEINTVIEDVIVAPALFSVRQGGLLIDVTEGGVTSNGAGFVSGQGTNIRAKKDICLNLLKYTLRNSRHETGLFGLTHNNVDTSRGYGLHTTLLGDKNITLQSTGGDILGDAAVIMTGGDLVTKALGNIRFKGGIFDHEETRDSFSISLTNPLMNAIAIAANGGDTGDVLSTLDPFAGSMMDLFKTPNALTGGADAMSAAIEGYSLLSSFSNPGSSIGSEILNRYTSVGLNFTHSHTDSHWQTVKRGVISANNWISEAGETLELGAVDAHIRGNMSVKAKIFDLIAQETRSSEKTTETSVGVSLNVITLTPSGSVSHNEVTSQSHAYHGTRLNIGGNLEMHVDLLRNKGGDINIQGSLLGEAKKVEMETLVNRTEGSQHGFQMSGSSEGLTGCGASIGRSIQEALVTGSLHAEGGFKDFKVGHTVLKGAALTGGKVETAFSSDTLEFQDVVARSTATQVSASFSEGRNMTVGKGAFSFADREEVARSTVEHVKTQSDIQGLNRDPSSFIEVKKDFRIDAKITAPISTNSEGFREDLNANGEKCFGENTDVSFSPSESLESIPFADEGGEKEGRFLASVSDSSETLDNNLFNPSEQVSINLENIGEPNNHVLVEINARNFMSAPSTLENPAETSYALLTRDEVNALTSDGSIGLLSSVKPEGFGKILEGTPMNLIEGFTTLDDQFGTLFSVGAKRDQERMIWENAGVFSGKLVKGCLTGAGSALLASVGPQFPLTLSSGCALGVGKEVLQAILIDPAIGVIGEGTSEVARYYGASDATASAIKMTTEFVASQVVDGFLNPRLPNMPHVDAPKSLSRTMVRENHFSENSAIKSLDKSGAIKYKGVEVKAVRNLDHLTEAEVKNMARHGTAPKDTHGNPLILHHVKQQDHRDPGAALVMIPAPKDDKARYHTIGNTRQHPLGNKGGIGEEARKDFEKFRPSFYKEFGKQELEKRGLK